MDTTIIFHFVHFPEVRTICIALNYEQWWPVLDTIRVYRRQDDSDYQFDSPYATRADVVTINDVPIKMEFYKVRLNGSSSYLHEIKPGDPNPFAQQPQQQEEPVVDNPFDGFDH